MFLWIKLTFEFPDIDNGEDRDEKQNVKIEMKTKEFFQFLAQIENIKYCLESVHNN